MLAFKDGDDDRFVELVEALKQRVFAFAFRFLGNAADAEDAAQEVFIKVYNARDAYVPSARFTTWLFTITRNTCLNLLEKRKKTSSVSLDEMLPGPDGPPARQLADSKDVPPAELALDKELASAVKEAVDSLPENQRTAVLLCRYSGLSYDAAAEVMGCSVKAVKSVLHRAKTGLKEKLAYLLKR